jgi:hydroxymethylglutaryl-CoA lyase
MNLPPIALTECPRDAMQGIKEFISTELKVQYLNTLLKAGFDVLDFGSFVSPKAIPQMADTEEVLAGLNLDGTNTKLLAIVANKRGAEKAASFNQISYLGYPFSISNTFQLRNTNTSLVDSLPKLAEIKNISDKSNKELVVYLSMAFGNPYGDEYNEDVAIEWAKKLYNEFGITEIALSDTIGSAEPQAITKIFEALIPALPEVNFGAHFHTTIQTWYEKVDSAYQAGCRKFDGAIKGYGGCPMAKDELTGNMPTELMVAYFRDKKEKVPTHQAICDCLSASELIFGA